MKDRQERLKELSQAKRALLLKAARKETTARQEARAIPRRRQYSPTPLSFAQQRLWFLDQLAPGSVAYNMPTAMRMDGALDAGALWRSLDEIVRRHEALRTTFATVDEQPVQVIATALAVPFPLLDLQALPATERMAQALRLATEEARLPFDLARGPLVRAKLLRLSGQAHVLLLTMHHIVSDGWSIGVMVRELAALYAAFADGRPSPLPPLPIQYADFALWQRAWLQGDTETRRHGDTETRRRLETPSPTPNTQHPTPIQTQLAYWKEQLGGRLPVLDLPSDRPRPAVQTFCGAERAALIPAPLAEALTALSRREGATLFMTLLAAFQALLHRYSGQDDLIVGSPIANRERFQTEGLIGFFVNQLVLRGDLRGNPTFRELLARVREVCLQAYAHQDLPFEMLVEKLQPERDLSRTPLFQVMFVLQNALQPVLEPSELSLSPLAVENKTTKFDLTLALTEGAQGLAGGWEYSVDLFDTTTISRIDEHFQTLLHGAAADPDLRLGDLPLLTEAESQQLLVEWNAPDQGVRGQGSGVRSERSDSSLRASGSWCVHHLFAAQAARTPDAIAIVYDGPQPGVRGQGSGVSETRRYGDTETRRQELGVRSQESGVRSQESEFLAPNPQSPTPLPPPAGRGTEAGSASASALQLLPASGGTEGGRAGASSVLNPQSLTYRELNERANHLAHHLRTLGVGPEVLVGVCMERSLELLVALLGVLKAGGAYVPLDPSYPAARLAFMLEDAQVPVLLTTTDHRPPTTDHRPPTTDHRSADTVTLSPLHLVTLSSSWSAIALCAGHNPGGALDPANLAYVIYTSGSTGRPKGAAISHRNAVALLEWAREQFSAEQLHGVLAATAISFDLSVFELFVPLCCGGTVLLAQDVLQLPTLRSAALVTLVNTVPSAMAELLRADALPSAVRTINLAGEVLPLALAQQLAQHSPLAQLYNLYGPSEATTYATCARILPHDTAAPPIGRPIAGTQVYLLDRYANPLPIGVVGELYIGGAGLARGYLHRPDLTAERFVPNPFAGVMGDGCRVSGGRSPNTRHPTPNTRLYRTGDLARYRPDGQLEFLGRSDEQVKLRGYRIELGEIESVLRQHAHVQDAVVLAREDAVGDKRLVAYLVTSHKSQVTSEGGDGLVTRYSLLVTQLRGFLQERLPSYMLPAAFVPLDALPLTPNGKLDRRALPAPADARSVPTAFVAARTPEEELLAQIWGAVLGVAQLGVEDNFFALGGHSLLATQVVARVRETFAVELPLRALFEAPTVAALAVVLVATRQAAVGLPAPPLRPVKRSTSLPLSFAQRRLWFLDRLQPGLPTYNIPAAMRLTGALDAAALQASFNEIIRRHEVLRTTFVLAGEQPVQRIARPAPHPLVVVDLRALPAAEPDVAAGRLAAAEARQPFDLARGPLIRTALLRLEQAEHLLLLTMHHIVADGWSLGVLLRELAALYGAFADGRPSPLPELPIQYADYAVWQHQWLQGSGRQGDKETRRQGDKEPEDAAPATQNSKLKTQNFVPIPARPLRYACPPSPIQTQLAYWQRQLGAALRPLELPTDRVRPPLQTFRGAHHSATLPLPLSQALAALSRGAGATLFMTLLAAFQALLSRYCSQEDIAVGAPIANRTQHATEQLIGCFVNTLVLRASLAGTPTFTTLLRQVREVCLGAYAHQDLPFELLVEALHPERDLSRQPLVQVLFALQNTPLPDLELPGLALRPLPIASATAKFDLSFSLAETPQGLASVWEYSADLFDATTIQRMQTHFQTLLAGIVATPDRPLATLPLLTEAERQQLLIFWNVTWGEFRSQESGVRSEMACIQDLFADQATRTPDAVAVVYDGPQPGVRGQGSGVSKTRRHGDTETGRQEAEFLAPNRQSPTPLPLPASGGTEAGSASASALQLLPARAGTEGGRAGTSSILNPQSLTYRELNERANHLAHHLRTLGVGPEVLVGVCMERSLELLVALLGVLKAGGAYVPLDPSYPTARLAFMLEDAQVQILLTTTDHRPPTTDHRPPTTDHRSADTVTLSPLHLVTLSSSWSAIALCAGHNPGGALDPANLAYVIYTSGSTGRPKGVAISHRNAVALLEWAREQFSAEQLHGVLAATAISFDLSVFELFVPLCCGGTVLLAQDVLQLPTLRSAALVTLVNTVPSAMAELLRADALPSAVRTINLAGEVLPLALAQQLAQRCPLAQLYNLYGPSEATTYATCARILPHDTAAPPIGRPISGTQVYLLDRYANPLPIGVVGELYIGGAGLARGYLHRPDLTAERFVPNPFAGVMGDGCWVLEEAAPNTRHPSPITRLYRTGDLARYRSDGQIEFVGRADEQVKLRGYRIELGEIESVLRQHAHVQDAVVLAREDTPGEKQLVAYIVEGSGVRDQGSGDTETRRHGDKETRSRERPTPHPSPPPALRLSPVPHPPIPELRGFLQERLPSYMLPAAFVPLDALPLTPNGKLDRRALPAPDRTGVEGRRDTVAPRTPLELQLVRIWEELLDRRPISVTDNFFELGGHSLLAMRLTTHIQRRLGQELPLAALFQAATVEQLATLLQQHKPESRSPLVAIQVGGARRPFFCVHPVGGDVLCYATLARQLAPDQPFYGLRAAGLDEQTEPCADARSMATRYIDALRAVQPHGPYLLGGWSMGGVIAFEMAGQLRAHGEEVALLALLDAWTPALAALPPDDDLALLAGFAQDLGLPPDHVLPALDHARQLEPDALLPVLLEQARASHAVPPDIELSQVQRLFHVFKTHTQALRSYVPQVYPGRLTLLRASERFAADGQDSAQGWGALAAGGVAQYAVPGSHYTILRSPHVQRLGERLSACLDEAHGLD